MGPPNGAPGGPPDKRADPEASRKLMAFLKKPGGPGGPPAAGPGGPQGGGPGEGPNLGGTPVCCPQHCGACGSFGCTVVTSVALVVLQAQVSARG